MTAQCLTSHQHCSKCSDQSHHNRMQNWIAIASHYPKGSREQNHYLTRIIRDISPKLWRANTAHYPDALQKTWRFFVEHVCTSYDPSRGCIISWLNSYLWYRHQDLLKQSLKRQQHELAIDFWAASSEGLWRGTIRDVSAQDYGSLSLLDRVLQWVKSDLDHNIRNTHIRNRPDVNAQSLILLRLPPETPWKEISTQFNVSVPTLSGFYQRKCLPLLREFGQSQGFL